MSDLSIADVLERAADLIEPEGAWTTRAYARTARGHEIGPEYPGATCFCAMGAIRRAAHNDHVLTHGALRLVGTGLPPGRDFYAHTGGSAYAAAVAQWNDAPGRTQTEVVQALRKTASLAREEEVGS